MSYLVRKVHHKQDQEGKILPLCTFKRAPPKNSSNYNKYFNAQLWTIKINAEKSMMNKMLKFEVVSITNFSFCFRFQHGKAMVVILSLLKILVFCLLWLLCLKPALCSPHPSSFPANKYQEKIYYIVMLMMTKKWFKKISAVGTWNSV